MGRQHVGHGEIVAFAQDKVNLPKDKADEYRRKPAGFARNWKATLANTRTSR